MTGNFGWFFMSSITQKNDFFFSISVLAFSGQIKEIKATCFVKQPLISTIGAFLEASNWFFFVGFLEKVKTRKKILRLPDIYTFIWG